jgi:hypothetical protein
MRVSQRWAVGVTFALLAFPGDLARAQSSNELRLPQSFGSISDQNARSRALFSESQGAHEPPVHELPPSGRSPHPGQ